jgi:hypothetical protein
MSFFTKLICRIIGINNNMSNLELNRYVFFFGWLDTKHYWRPAIFSVQINDIFETIINKNR